MNGIAASRSSSPSSTSFISRIRPRGESISSSSVAYVGHVGRQKPQWTQEPIAPAISAA